VARDAVQCDRNIRSNLLAQSSGYVIPRDAGSADTSVHRHILEDSCLQLETMNTASNSEIVKVCAEVTARPQNGTVSKWHKVAMTNIIRWDLPPPHPQM